MATEPEDDGARRRACHGMLLRLAGRVPDDLTWQAREWLAEGRYVELARAVTFVTVSQRVPLAERDTVYLAELLEAAGDDSAVIGEAEVTNGDPMPYYEFEPTLPGGRAAAADRAATDAVERLPGVRGLWATWRLPPGQGAWPLPRRVFVAETDADADLAACTRELHRALAPAGEVYPQVEVVATGEPLPAYQMAARTAGELLWAAADGPRIRMAAVFDEEGLPRFAADHPRVDDEERDRVLGYLGAGEPLLLTTARLDDVVDAARKGAVPMNFRTDGTWIWTDATGYYLREHHLAPDRELLAHIRSVRYALPEVDGVAAYRAMVFLRQPAEEESVTSTENP
jgi:hypothetical protein